jgi:hypothetical protein
MADDDDRVERGNAMWQRYVDLVPRESLARPVPKPVPVPAPEPVPQAMPDEDAIVRAKQLQILQDRQKADQTIRDIERKAQQDAFESMQRIHEIQKNLKL